jgi:hypothetical protein
MVRPDSGPNQLRALTHQTDIDSLRTRTAHPFKESDDAHSVKLLPLVMRQGERLLAGRPMISFRRSDLIVAVDLLEAGPRRLFWLVCG